MNNTNSYLIKEKQVEMASWLKKKKKVISVILEHRNNIKAKV